MSDQPSTGSHYRGTWIQGPSRAHADHGREAGKEPHPDAVHCVRAAIRIYDPAEPRIWWIGSGGSEYLLTNIDPMVLISRV